MAAFFIFSATLTK